VTTGHPLCGPNCPTAQLPNCPTAQLPNCPTALQVVSCGDNDWASTVWAQLVDTANTPEGGCGAAAAVASEDADETPVVAIAIGVSLGFLALLALCCCCWWWFFVVGKRRRRCVCAWSILQSVGRLWWRI
jgi:hypothetical protein